MTSGTPPASIAASFSYPQKLVSRNDTEVLTHYARRRHPRLGAAFFTLQALIASLRYSTFVLVLLGLFRRFLRGGFLCCGLFRSRLLCRRFFARRLRLLGRGLLLRLDLLARAAEVRA